MSSRLETDNIIRRNAVEKLHRAIVVAGVRAWNFGSLRNVLGVCEPGVLALVRWVGVQLILAHKHPLIGGVPRWI